MTDTMRFKKVLLVSPRFFLGRNKLSLQPPAGLAYIALALSKVGIEAAVFDMNLGYHYKDLVKKIKHFKPDCIGLTAMTLGYRYFYELIDTIKKEFPEIKIVVGGAHISALREQVLKECSAIDFGIFLEGDEAIVALCQNKDLKDIPGLIYRENGTIKKNDHGGFIQNLDALSFPKYEQFELDKYPAKQIGIVTSRGCPYSCIYCSVIATIGKKFRYRSATSIFEEISYWYAQGYRHIYILDDNFTLLPDRVMQLCALLKKSGFEGLHLKCPNGIRADRVTYEILKEMRQAGFDMVAFGVEASRNNVLKNLKKGETIEEMEKSIAQACSLGFDVDLFFLLGSPGETIEDIEHSFAFAQRFPLRRAIFYNLIPLPATELLSWLQEKKYMVYPLSEILNNASYYKNTPCFFTPEISIEERKRIFEKGRAVLLTIRRRHIERKLQGPLLLRKLFSYLYTLPVVDEMIINNAFVVKIKEEIKKHALG